MTTILVTGATGTIGTATIENLLSRPNVTVRAGVHSRPASALRGAAQPVEVDFARPETITSAAHGVDAVFMITPPAPNQVELATGVLKGLKAANVLRLVRLSVAAADRPGVAHFMDAHAAMEAQIRESGIPHTFLRPNSFMSNFLTHYRPHPDGNIRLPWGNGAVAHVDPRDVADVAAEALTTDTHLGKAYTLSGPEAITADQIASSISKATGQRIKYIDMPEEAMRQAMISSGMPPMMIEGLLNLWAAMKAGRLSDVTQTIPELLGRRARSFDQFARDHAGSWKTL